MAASDTASSTARTRPGALYRLLYSSVATTDLNSAQLDVLLGAARAKNQRNDITGLLVHLHDVRPGLAYFVQTLEGPRAAVERTYRRIAADELHSDLSILNAEPARTRSFGQWAMGLHRLDGPDIAQRQIGTDDTDRGSWVLTPVERWIRDRTSMEMLVHQLARGPGDSQ